MNETLNTIAGRSSCRKYTDQPLSREQLEQIALAAVQAPSGMNRQPWSIYVINDQTLLADMDRAALDFVKAMPDQQTYTRFMERGGTMFYRVPCMFLVAGEPEAALDAGIVAQNIALAATALGLGSVICGIAALSFQGENKAVFKRRIGIPDGEEFHISVLVGHAAAHSAPHEPDKSKIKYIT